MKARMKRPSLLPKTQKPRQRSRMLPAEVLEKIAESVRYVGSAEHKDIRNSYAGEARPRGDAELCPLGFSTTEEERLRMETHLKEAILQNNISPMGTTDTFPRYVWTNTLGDGLIYEARLVNCMQGTYKGYPRTDMKVLPKELKPC